MVRAKPYLAILTVKLLHEHIKRSHKVSHGYALVDNKRFHLVEYGRVSGVHSVGAVNSAGGDNPYRRLLIFHYVHLNRGCLGPQKHVIRDIEGVLRVPCRVIRREVEGFKVVVVIFDLGTFCNIESHAQKDLFDFV